MFLCRDINESWEPIAVIHLKAFSVDLPWNCSNIHSVSIKWRGNTHDRLMVFSRPRRLQIHCILEHRQLLQYRNIHSLLHCHRHMHQLHMIHSIFLHQPVRKANSWHKPSFLRLHLALLEWFSFWSWNTKKRPKSAISLSSCTVRQSRLMLLPTQGGQNRCV